MTLAEWEEKVKILNEHINSLKVWDDYAQDCQIAYDRLLQQKPKE